MSSTRLRRRTLLGLSAAAAVWAVGASGAFANRPTPARLTPEDRADIARVEQYLNSVRTLRARILLLGMPVEIQRAEVNGLQVNRVRVGPFARLDDMNRTRARLAQENIVSTVVRQ